MMRIICLILVFVLGIFTGSSQVNDIKEKFALPIKPDNLSESSGIIFFNNKVITHNDSGGESKLYEVDMDTGLVTRAVTISNATNVDWEDITQDENYIYVGDIGNNSGNRTDLKIYKISKTSYLASTTVTAEVIAFSYSNQVDFSSKVNNNEWDAEALVSFNESNLILISKNWTGGATKGYLVSKTAGKYSLSPLVTTLSNSGLITGATYNMLSEKLFLVGYTSLTSPAPLQPFVWKCEDFIGNDVFSGTNTQTSLSSTFSFEQTEAITFVNENNYFMTSEAFSVSVISDHAKLISFTTDDKISFLEKKDTTTNIVLPLNSVSDFLYVNNKNVNSIEIYDTKLIQVYRGFNNVIDMSGFGSGIYIAKINLDNNSHVIRKVVK